MYVVAVSVVAISSGVNVVVLLCDGIRDVSFSLYVRFRLEFPRLVNLIEGV